MPCVQCLDCLSYTKNDLRLALQSFFLSHLDFYGTLLIFSITEGLGLKDGMESLYAPVTLTGHF